MNKITALIDKTLNTDVTPLAYVYAFYHFVFGFAMFSGLLTNATLFKIGALVGPTLWGGILVFAMIALILGMAAKSKPLTTFGGFGGAMAWIFATISYFMGGYPVFAVLAILFVVAHGYFIFSATLDRLWNYAPRV